MVAVVQQMAVATSVWVSFSPNSLPNGIGPRLRDCQDGIVARRSPGNNTIPRGRRFQVAYRFPAWIRRSGLWENKYPRSISWQKLWHSGP